MKHHLSPLGDRQIALSAAFSSIIVEINVFRSFRLPFHTNLPFFSPKVPSKDSVVVDKFMLQAGLLIVRSPIRSIIIAIYNSYILHNTSTTCEI